jgi:two-component system, sensor histidine kinase YesM
VTSITRGIKGGFKVRLFIKISLIIVISIVVTNIFTGFMSIKITERLFINSFTISNNRILDEIISNFESFNIQTVSIINIYKQNKDIKELLTQDVIEQKKLFRMFFDINNYLNSANQTSILPNFNISILGKNGSIFGTAVQKLTYTSEKLEHHPITEKVLSDPNQISYSYAFSKPTNTLEESHVIVVTKKLITPNTLSEFGTIYLSINETNFREMYRGAVTEGSDVLMLSSVGQIVSSNKNELVGTFDSDLLKILENNINFMHQNKQSFIIAKYLPIYDMYIVNIVEKNSLLKDFLGYRLIIFIACFTILLFVIILVFIITHRITRPIYRIVSHMRYVRGGNFSKIKQITGSYEVIELQKTYNFMVDEIQEHIKKLILEQNERRKSEIHALQMQINPHFLYNTLASIKYLSWLGDSETISNTINALIVLLQNTIGKMDEKITVENDLINLNSYVTISHARYGNKINVAFNINDEFMNCLIPKLIIQPFLENAFFHAFQKKQGGLIRIFMRKCGGDLICEVIDDGDGMNTDQYINLFKENGYDNKFSGIGLYNVNERLKLIYGENCGVGIISKEGVGTTVTITMKYEINTKK